MATYSITVNGRAATVTGTKNFAKRVTGHKTSGAVEVISGDGTRAQVVFAPATESHVDWANNASGNAMVDAIITAANAAS